VATVNNILHDTWQHQAIHAESIPHFLHWDLAYLWILQQDPGQRPDQWEFRIRGWKRLLHQFLLGRLSVRPEPLPYRLRDRAMTSGIQEAGLLYLGDTLVGVLSHTVLVRPLPDFVREDLALIPEPEPGELGPLAQFLGLLKEQVAGLRERGPLFGGLERVIAGEFAAVQARVLPAAAAGIFWPERREPVLLLKRVEWLEQAEPADLLEPVSVMVCEREEPRRVFLPACRHCQAPLTTEREQTTEVDGPEVALLCAKPECRAENRIPLERFLIWLRESDAVVWTDRDFPIADAAKSAPPEAQVAGNLVEFEWRPSALPASRGRRGPDRRWLRLRFPGRALRALALDRIFFKRILVPGSDRQDFSGLPVRSEWFQALESPVQPQVTPDRISYPALKLRGWPFPIEKHYGSLSVEEDREIALAVYPKPMHPGWKPYRVAALGRSASKYRLAGHGALPHVAHCDGWPEMVSLESADGAAGATWDLRDLRARPPSSPAAPNIDLGIDFGTTNTVIYFQDDGTDEPLDATRNALQPGALAGLVHWVHPRRPNPEALSWFLPGPPRDPEQGYLIPSAFWQMEGVEFTPIRWNSCLPSASAKPVHGFKWDKGTLDRRQERRQYLEELLFLATPYILERLEVRNRAASLRLGFSYPLAFDRKKRLEFQNLLKQVAAGFAQRSGMQVSLVSINESLASLRAFGAPPARQMFLVADMGGGTMDLALFRYRPNGGDREDIEQIGSVEFGGEVFIERLAEELGRPYWEIRDAVTGHSAHDLGRTDVMGRLLERFQPMALEFLRTMLAAYRKKNPDEDLRLLLAGNGWRLRELALPGRDPAGAFDRYFADMIGYFGDARAVFGKHSIPGIPSAKHWVACGALRNAKRGQTQELEADYPSALPAGRAVRFDSASVDWHALVGEGGWRVPLPDEAIRNGRIDCEFENGPPLPESWRPFFDNAVTLRDRYPDPDQFREALIKHISGGRLLKGPLTLILETHWKKTI